MAGLGSDGSYPSRDRVEVKVDGPGIIVGRYQLIEKIGEGGFASVYVAEQKEPVRRRVALKILKHGMDTQTVVARFEAERQALAMMDHPNIARVLDAGATETGRPFFVMELVIGQKLSDYCKRHQLSVRQRLELFVPVCRGVQHAHQKGIIHRDLKPSNILVTEHEGMALPKVIDFGIAKATEKTPQEGEGLTSLNVFVGTPAYMSPEQVAFGARDVDTRSDIYSLGVILYELLTGGPPFDVTGSGLELICRMILETDPQRPSSALAKNLEQTRLRSPRLAWREQVAAVRGDLDCIVMKCLEKDRSRRYETANGLAADLQRYLSNEPVIARPPSVRYRLFKAWQRNKLAFAAAGAVTATLLLAIVVSTWQAVEANRARVAETKQRLRADAEKAEARRLLYGADMSLAQQAWEQNNIVRLRQLLQETEESSDRGFEWYYWQRRIHPPLKTLRGHSRAVTSAAFSPDGTRIVTTGEDGIAQVWDAATGRKLTLFKGYGAPIYGVAFSPDGRWIVNGGEAQNATVWETESGRLRLTLKGHSGTVWSVAFSPDGQRIATAGEDGTATVWDIETGHEILTLRGHKKRVWSVAFSPDGRRIASASLDQTAKVWDTATGRELVTLRHSDLVWGVAFSPDGQQLLTGCEDALARVWEASSGRELLTLRGHTAGVGAVAFSPDGRRIGTGSADDTIKVWDPATGQELLSLKGHTSWLISVAFSPDSRLLLSASQDTTAKIWDAAPDRNPLIIRGHGGLIRDVAFSPDSQKIITASQDATAKVWDAATGAELLTVKVPGDEFLSAAFSPDGRRILTGTGETVNVATLWDAATGRKLLTFEGHQARVASVEFSPDGGRILTGSWDNSARVWDATSGRELLSIARPTNRVHCAVFSPDGQRIAAIYDDSTANLYSATTGQKVLSLQGHRAFLHSIAFSHDGSRIVTGSEDQTAKVWDAAKGRELLTLAGHRSAVMSAAFSADGRRIVTGSVDQTAKIWDVGSDITSGKGARELLTLRGHTALIYSVAFSPDGRRIATASADRTIRVWEAALPQQVIAWHDEENVQAPDLPSGETREK